MNGLKFTDFLIKYRESGCPLIFYYIIFLFHLFGDRCFMIMSKMMLYSSRTNFTLSIKGSRLRSTQWVGNVQLSNWHQKNLKIFLP